MEGLRRRSWLFVAILGVVVVAALIFGLADDEEDERVVSLGEGEVTVPTSDDDSPTDELQTNIVALIEQAGFPADVVECYELEVGALPEPELERVVELQQTDAPRAVVAEAMRPLKRKLASECIGPGLADVPSDLDDNEVAILKESIAIQLETGQVFPNSLSPPIAACVAEKVRTLPVAEFRELVELPTRNSQKRFAGFARECAE